MLNVWPFLVGRKTADKTVTRIDFYTSVLVAVSAMVYFLWLLIWIVVAIVSRLFALGIICILAPFLAWFALWFTERYQDWTFRQQFERLQRDEPARILALKSLRKELLDI